MKQLFVLLLLLWAGRLPAVDEFYCSSCGARSQKAYAIQTIAGEKKRICKRCFYLVPRCGICRMPVKADKTRRLDDGRIVCVDDYQAGTFSQDEAVAVWRETRRELSRVFYRFSMQFPETNVVISLVAADHLHELAGFPYSPASPEVEGLTKPLFFDSSAQEMDEDDVLLRHKKPARTEYTIYLVAGLPRARLMSVCAHEYGHVWHLENLNIQRSLRLERKTREAFCELVAYQLMDAMNEPFEKAVIEANLYTYGQARLLIEVEKDYGFFRILEWMKNGVDLNLSREDLDRIRLVGGSQTAASPNAPAFVSYAAPKIPETLMLKGILGGSRKLALINNQSLAVSETAKVKVGTTNVSVEVIEIRTNSVLIRTNGSSEPQELFLPN